MPPSAASAITKGMQLPSVLNYSDFRTYLRDLTAARKARTPGFQFASWAKRLGLRSHSSLVMILQGQRNPGPDLVERLVKDLRLTGKEAAFFRDLICLEKCAKGSAMEEVVKERLAQLHPKRSFAALDARTFAAVSNWYYYAIRELVDTKDFREDVAWIQKRLNGRLMRKEVTEAIETLVHLNLLHRDANGILRYTQAVESSFDVPDSSLRRYHAQILQMAAAALNDVPVQEREIAGTTFTLRKEDLPRAKEIMRNALREVERLGAGGGDEVYHAEVALFPLSENGGSKWEH